MYLYENREAFIRSIKVTAKRSGLEETLIERDYYNSVVMSELAELYSVLPFSITGYYIFEKKHNNFYRVPDNMAIVVHTDSWMDMQKILGYSDILNRTKWVYVTEEELKLEYSFQPATKPITPYGEPAKTQDVLKFSISGTSSKINSVPTTMCSLIEQYATTEERMLLKSKYTATACVVPVLNENFMFVNSLFTLEDNYKKKDMFNVASNLYTLSELACTTEVENLLNEHLAYKEMSDFTDIVELQKKSNRGTISDDTLEKSFADFETLKLTATQPLIDAHIDVAQHCVIDKSKILPSHITLAVMEAIARVIV